MPGVDLSINLIVAGLNVRRLSPPPFRRCRTLRKLNASFGDVFGEHEIYRDRASTRDRCTARSLGHPCSGNHGDGPAIALHEKPGIRADVPRFDITPGALRHGGLD